jgi:hypothetical protein
LRLDAGSFFSHGLRVKGQSGPDDVSCGLFVSLSAVPAGAANEFCLCDES